MEEQGESLIRFYQLIDGARPPHRADRAAGGVLPTRAFRYCEAITTASSLGWYIYPPMSFSLYWDGTDICWTYDGADGWFDLTTAQYPYFSDRFDSSAPRDLKGFSPPFLAALPEPGVVQVWSGLIARTRSNWSILIRSPIHVPRSGGYEVFEGVVEADAWFGPLFTNIRLTRTHSPIAISMEVPFFQVQPLPRFAYTDAMLNDFKVVNGLERLDKSDWSAYRSTVVKSSDGVSCPIGRNATQVRQRRRSEIKASVSATPPAEVDPSL